MRHASVFLANAVMVFESQSNSHPKQFSLAEVSHNILKTRANHIPLYVLGFGPLKI